MGPDVHHCQVAGGTGVGQTIDLRGRYRVLNDTFLRERANRSNDPRHEFYRAMLSNRTYEGYLAEVSGKIVEVPSHPSAPITGRMEILYARRNRWIKDV